MGLDEPAGFGHLDETAGFGGPDEAAGRGLYSLNPNDDVLVFVPAVVIWPASRWPQSAFGFRAPGRGGLADGRSSAYNRSLCRPAEETGTEAWIRARA